MYQLPDKGLPSIINNCCILKIKYGRLELARASLRKHMNRMFAWVFFIFTNNSARWWWMMMTRSHDSQWQSNLSIMMMMMKMMMIHNDNWIFGPLLMVRQMPDWEADERKLLSEFQPGVVTTRETPQMWIRIVDYIWSELWIIFITILYNILLEF